MALSSTISPPPSPPPLWFRGGGGSVKRNNNNNSRNNGGRRKNGEGQQRRGGGRRERILLSTPRWFVIVIRTSVKSNRRLFVILTPLLLIFLWTTFRLHWKLCNTAALRGGRICDTVCDGDTQQASFDHSSIAQQEMDWELTPGETKKCLSPEMDKRWIFGNNCTFVPNSSSKKAGGTSSSRSTTCTFCRHRGRYAEYFERLSQVLQKQKGMECSRLVVYGVAFGKNYVDWLTKSTSPSSSSYDTNKPNQHSSSGSSSNFRKNTERQQQQYDTEQVLRRHGRCFLTFVLAESLVIEDSLQSTTTTASSSSLGDLALNNTLSLEHTSSDGLMILVPIRRQDLPYVSMRRNTKLFKMMGHILFGWSQRIFWQDSKLLADPTKPRNLLPTDYFAYFDQTIDRQRVCVSFMGLPLHKNTVGRGVKQQTTVQFQSHCQAIAEASIKRPTVSDSLATLQSQCGAYQYEMESLRELMQHSPEQWGSHGTLDTALIDSAFMVWDMRSSRCRDFSKELCCRWLDEIHCYSDRDQVSFPFAFVKMGLREIGGGGGGNSRSQPHHHAVQPAVPERQHRVFAQTGTLPLVHIAKSSCHWYYQSLNDCDFGKDDEKSPVFSLFSWLLRPSRAKEVREPPRLRLAIVVAGSLRRFLFQSSVEKLVAPLVAQGHLADYYLSLTTEEAPAYRATAYMSRITYDPFFFGISTQDNETSSLATRRPGALEKLIRQALDTAGGRLRRLILRDQANIDGNARVRERRERASSLHEDEDPDLRFPVVDLRGKAREKTANANRNMLRLFLNIQELWKNVVDAEYKDGMPYDYILFLRDDTLWLADFDMNSLVSSSPVADLFVPSCDARIPPMASSEINDHIAVVRRNKADIFGNYFDELFAADLDACGEHVEASIRKGGERGCNSEMILQWILERNNVLIHPVGQGLIPFQRSAHVKMPDGQIQTCFHKYCQSHADRLPDTGLEMCRDLSLS